jgi:hypothetical protein
MPKPKSKTISSKTTHKTKSIATPSRSRQIKVAPKITGSFQLFGKSLMLIKRNWKLFGVIIIIYGLLAIVLVRGFGGSLDLALLKKLLHSQTNNLTAGFTLFGYLLGGAGSVGTQAGSVYQTILVILISLITIWSLREILGGKKVKAKDAFYKGTYPLIPFILVLLIIGLQLLPLVLGAWLYGTILGTSIAVNLFEKFCWTILFLLLAFWSIYMVSTSVIGLYVVTLPNMTPFKALRSAKQLVKHRRFKIIRKVLFLPLALFVIGALIMVPLILLLTSLAVWVYFVLSMVGLLVIHTYMYLLYRELL